MKKLFLFQEKCMQFFEWNELFSWNCNNIFQNSLQIINSTYIDIEIPLYKEQSVFSQFLILEEILVPIQMKSPCPNAQGTLHYGEATVHYGEVTIHCG